MCEAVKISQAVTKNHEKSAEVEDPEYELLKGKDRTAQQAANECHPATSCSVAKDYNDDRAYLPMIHRKWRVGE